jgi:hypothetical protein
MPMPAGRLRSRAHPSDPGLGAGNVRAVDVETLLQSRERSSRDELRAECCIHAKAIAGVSGSEPRQVSRGWTYTVLYARLSSPEWTVPIRRWWSRSPPELVTKC